MKYMVWIITILVSNTMWAAITVAPKKVSSPGNRKIIQSLLCQTPMGLYNECHYSSIGHANLLIEGTEGDCRLNSTYGIKPNYVWVKNDCRVSFTITRVL